jgi:hypothetical protein
MNKEAIGDPTVAANQASTNSIILPQSTLLIRAKKKKLQSGAHPSHQRYNIVFRGIGTATNAEHTVQVTMDFFSLKDDINNYNDHAISIPSGLKSLQRIEIQKVPNDSISTASAGLVIQTIAIESDTFLFDGFSEQQRKFLKGLSEAQGFTHKVDGIVSSTDANYSTADFDGSQLFVLKANFGKLTGLTASDIVELNDGGIVLADETNRRWNVLFGSDDLSNSLIALNGSNVIYHYRGGTDFKQIAPIKLDNIDSSDTATVKDPDNFSVLKYYHVPTGSQGYWVAQSSPFETYSRNTTAFEDGDHIADRVVVTAGAQSGAGVPGYSGRAYTLDVRKDTKVVTYFDSAKRDALLYNPDFAQTLAVLLKSTTGGETFKYNVKVTGKNAADSVITEDIVFEGKLEKFPQWFSVDLPETFKKVNNLEWTDASTGSADADLSRYGRLIMTGIYNIAMLRKLPGLAEVAQDPGEY